MSYVATAVVRGKGGWGATDLDLGGVADLDEVVDRLREVDPDADVSLLLVESDDAYFAVVRLDQGEDPRVFGSDAAFASESRLGQLLLGEVEVPALEIADAISAVAAEPDAEEPAADPEAEPVGDADLLADLGLSAHRLILTVTREGMLPADMTAEVAQAVGGGDELEELREA